MTAIGGSTAFSVSSRRYNGEAQPIFSRKMQPTESGTVKSSKSLRSTLMHAQELIFFMPEDTAANYVALSLRVVGK